MASRGKVGHFLKSTVINDLQNRVQFKISAYMDDEEGPSCLTKIYCADLDTGNVSADGVN